MHTQHTCTLHWLQVSVSPPPAGTGAMLPVTGSSTSSTSSSGEMFHTLDHEKTLLVEKMCQLKRQMARREEKLEFYDGHSQQLTEAIRENQGAYT